MDDWERLANDPIIPWKTRAISGQYPAGSTYKPILAAAALEEGLITPETTFYCNGTFEMATGDVSLLAAKGTRPNQSASGTRGVLASKFYNLGKLLAWSANRAYARAFGLVPLWHRPETGEKGGLTLRSSGN